MDSDKITASEIVSSRGWTRRLIDKFLGEPDEMRPNPHYRSGSPMRLYLLQRIKDVEATNAFRLEMVAVNRRRDSALVGNITRQEKTDAIVDGASISIKQLSQKDLIRRACDHYNDRNQDSVLRAHANSEQTFLHRICVNYLRHELSEYEEVLRAIKGCVGKDDAYIVLKRRVLKAIADKYPWLRQECEQQKEQMEKAIWT